VRSNRTPRYIVSAKDGRRYRAGKLVEFLEFLDLNIPDRTIDFTTDCYVMDLKTTTGHKYLIGQEVSFKPAILQTGSSREPYVVVRLLPGEGGSPQYHIKHKAGGLQRVVPEGQISPFDPPL
jgi:hypothetical protein